ncbi:hypothetical protein [Methanolobus vulcani]|uniref:hypothetical protein n=1 Tax=Methanolobus vulcani TaxID=38026 RepID=UPI000B82AD50|nr:hypothetical protein [Methanolobus vulcani]
MQTPKKRSCEIPTRTIERIARNASKNAIMNAFNHGLPVTRITGKETISYMMQRLRVFARQNGSVKL